MGAIVKAQDIRSSDTGGLLRPIIYCNPTDEIITTANSINIALTELLMKYKPNRRTMQLEKCFMQVLYSLPDRVVIKDFDVMFNPNYHVDIMMLLIAAYKKKPFSVIWPGDYRNGKLFYAKEGRPDYKAYCIDDYDVTCIV